VPLGASVRALFGPWEADLAIAYRRAFFDITAFARTAAAWAPESRTILEVGCGEGQVTEALIRRLPRAHALGIDLTPRVGRLYRGDRLAASFAQTPASAVAETFDLVVVCDVIHHVPEPDRDAFLTQVAGRVRTGGMLVVKEWIRSATPVHAVVHLSDRLLSQDRVSFWSAEETRTRVAAAAGPVVHEARIGPWHNNLVIGVPRVAPGGPS